MEYSNWGECGNREVPRRDPYHATMDVVEPLTFILESVQGTARWNHDGYNRHSPHDGSRNVECLDHPVDPPSLTIVVNRRIVDHRCRSGDGV